MKKNKLFWLLSLVLVLSVFLAACNGGDDDKDAGDNTDTPATNDEGNGDDSATGTPDAEQVLNLIEGAEIPSIDPSLAEDQVGFLVMNNVYEGLMRLNQENVAIPALAAEEPTVSDDGLVYTFKLRDDATWSDGSPVTAQDLEYSWKRAIDPATGSPYGPYMMSGVIKGAGDISAEGSTLTKDDLGVKATDEHTLEVTLERQVPYFMSLMSFGTFYPQKEEYVTQQGDKFSSNSETALYNGPFTLSDWDGTGLSWKYLKNDNYWDKDSVKLTQINWDVVKENSTAINLYETGEKDRVGLSGEFAMQYANDPDVITIPGTSVFYFKLNQERNGAKTPLANVNIREAITKGFNKQDMIDVVLANGSIEANYLVPKDFTFDENAKDFRDVNGDMAKFNVDEAKAAWEKGLSELGTKEVTLELLGGDSDLSKKMDEYIKGQLETNLPGLKVTLKEVPFNVRLELDDAQDYDIQFAGWGPDYQDPMTFIDLFVTGSSQNKMGYSNPEYDKLVNDAKTTLASDLAARWDAMAKAEHMLIAEDYAITPVYQKAGKGLQKPYVKGIVQHPFGGDYSYKWAYIEGKE